MTNWEFKREPTTPGEILKEEFLKPMGLTQKKLASHIGVDLKVINRIVNGRAGITAKVAIKLGSAFGTSPELWLNAQIATDLWNTNKLETNLPGIIKAA
ncbi:MAG: HigA family addiction module antitoxin [Nitrospinota bacterium]